MWNPTSLICGQLFHKFLSKENSSNLTLKGQVPSTATSRIYYISLPSCVKGGEWVIDDWLVGTSGGR